MPENTVPEVRRAIVEALSPYVEPGELLPLASVLLEHFAGITASLQHKADALKLKEEAIENIRRAVHKLQQGVPVQYITGEVEWYGMKLKVSPAVLIPRPETEELADKIIHMLAAAPPASILDIGTGSGCLALAMARKLRDAAIYGLDISADALEVAKENIETQKASVSLIQADFLDPRQWERLPLTEVIISNPPYIGIEEENTLAGRVKDHEPHLALFSPTQDPLEFYKALKNFIEQKHRMIKYIFLEVNEKHADEVKSLFTFGNLISTVEKDLQGKDRFVMVKHSKASAHD